MSNRFNNKKLLYILAGLVTILLVTLVIKVPKEKSTLRNKIVEFDTSQVNMIVLYPRVSPGKKVNFTKTNGRWDVKQDDIVAVPQEGAVQNIFREVLNLKPQSLAAINKSKWKEFDLTDSLATRIKFLNKNGRTLADLMIGRISYIPQENQNGQYGGNNMRVASFVRPYSDQRVYTVDGLISFSFNLKFDEWRDKTFIKSKKDDVTSIRFIYPADTSFTLSRNEKKWNTGYQPADSAIVSDYLASLVVMNGETCMDKYTPSASPVYQLMIEGNNLLKISIKCYEAGVNDEYVLNSSLNPDVYFTMKKTDLLTKLLKSRKSFFKKTGKH